MAGHGFTVANSAVAAVRAVGADSGSAMGLVGASQMLIALQVASWRWVVMPALRSAWGPLATLVCLA